MYSCPKWTSLCASFWRRLGANFLELRYGEVRRSPLLRASVNKDMRKNHGSRVVAPLDASSVLPHRFGRLCPVAHPQHLVDGAQVLLDRRLRQVQAPRYLGVAQALHDHLQDLSSTSREVPYFGVLVLAQDVP